MPSPQTGARPSDAEVDCTSNPGSNGILLVQTSIGDYRQCVLDALQTAWGSSFRILCGREYFASSLKTGVVCGNALAYVQNYFLFGRRLLFQSGVCAQAVKSRSVILEFNPRIINTWLVLLFRKLKGKKSIIWGHAWARNGTDNYLRRQMRALADVIIVYTEQQRVELAPHVPKSVLVIAAPNALYRRADMSVAGIPSSRKHFIFVGRLVSPKKPALLIDAFSRALPELSPETNLLIVGDGPERGKLESQISRLGLEKRIRLLGHIGDRSTLRELYGTSLASMSPGYVGLSITQSFSFGVPMIISRDEPHAPEIEAAQDGKNCVFFATDDESSLAKVMVEFYSQRAQWLSRSEQIVEQCKMNYSAELMAQRIREAVDYVQGISIST